MMNEAEQVLSGVGANPTAAVQGFFGSHDPARGRPLRGLKALLHAAPAAIFIAHDPQCRRITRSRAAREMLRPPEEGGSAPDASPVERPTRLKTFWADQVQELASLEVPVQQAARGVEMRGLELDVVSDDRVVKHIYGSAAPLLDESGRPAGAVAVFVDVTELKRSNQALAAKVRELVRSNAELERLAAVVAHDLRSPLLSLTGCASALCEEYPGNLSAEGRELVGHIQESASHMAHLIKSLLTDAAAEHGSLEVAPCDFNSVVRLAVNQFQAALHAAGGEVTSDILPVIQADETQMCQLLQNLIENAIKYCRDEPPHIHISVRREPGFWCFSVKDNGIGIDPQDFDSIFRPFEQLHPDTSQYAGLGLGLTTCKKIVERHGGRIRVESQPGQGATVFFSVPR
jgi:signal transduction histidine kinase